MGEVYRATDERLKRQVALKVLPLEVADHPDRVARFQREAEVLAALNHPDIAHLYGLEGLETPFLVMELVEGETLADRIAGGAIPLDEALPIARQIAQALEAAHEQGIIHRDLKPANIKVREDGTVKVLDFGLAKALGPATPVAGRSALTDSPTITSPALMTGAGVLLGTAAYMSPEQAKGRPADRASDLWAFGCVLYEMLAGRRPFDGDDVADTMVAILSREPDWVRLPAATPPSITRLLRRCLTRERVRRLADAGAARLDIEEAEAGTDARATPVAGGQPRTGTNSLLACAVGLVAGALAVWFLAPRRTEARIAAPLHLSITLPNDDDEVRALAVSPDGRTLALAADIGNQYQLWLRDLAGQEFKGLPGTNSGRSPFWSTDGRSLGFGADGKLKTISAAGGPAQSLCDAGPFWGGTWNRDGIILFGSGQNGPIMKVAASGGACTPLTRAESGSSHRFPEFLEDGHHFFYLVVRGDPAQRGVYVGSLEDPQGRRILPDETSIVYIPPAADRQSSLLFLRNHALMAVGFDRERLAVDGEPTVVADFVSRTNNVPQIAASADRAGMLAYLTNAAIDRPRQLVWYDRTGVERGRLQPQSGSIGLNLAPDNRSALVLAAGANYIDRSLSVEDLVRNARLRFAPSETSMGVWSPDGTKIAFGAVREGSPITRLFLKGLGEAEERLLSGGIYGIPSDWSRDGRYIAYTSGRDAVGDIWILPDPLDATSPRKPFPLVATPAAEGYAQFSPDGRWVAYASNESGDDEIYLKAFPSGIQRQVSIGGGREPRWRADGRELFYLLGETLTRLRLMSVDISAEGVPGRPKPLFEFHATSGATSTNWFLYAPSRDGQRFLVNRFETDARPQIHVVLHGRFSH